MPRLATLSVSLLAATSLLLIALAVAVWRRPRGEGSSALLCLVLAVLVWVLAYAGEILAPTVGAKLSFAGLQYAGIVAAPPAWLAFAARYTRSDAWITRRRLALIAAIPTLTLLMVWSNEAHGLIWRTVAVDPTAPLPLLVVTYGPWFWLHTLFSYLCMAAGSWLLARATLSSHYLFRWQAASLVLSAAVPWAANAAHVLRVWPLAPLDPSPLAFAISALLLGWCLLRYRLLDIVPIPPDIVLSGMGDGVLVVDRRGALVELNPAAERILGHARAAALGLPADRLLAPFPAVLEGCRAMRAVSTEVTIGQAPAARAYAAQVAPLADRRGRAAGALLLLHDVTERNLAEERRHYAALRRLAEQVTLQHVARAISANLSLDAIFGAVVAEVQAAFGYPLVCIYLVEDGALVLQAQVGQAPAAPRLALDQGVCARVARDGRPAFVREAQANPELAAVAPAAREVMVLPLQAGDGQALGTLLVGSAGAPALGEEDLGLLQLLAAQVSVAITNARLFADLRASEAAAGAAARARSEFLANMSHEVRTPLYGVIGAASLLLDRAPDDEQRLLLELIHSSAGSLMTMLSAILDFALLASGRPDLEQVPFALLRCVDDAVTALYPRAQAKGLELSYSVDEQAPEVLVSDPGRLGQILTLLLDNAVKYTAAGQVTVAVSARPLNDQRYTLTFAVQDTGPGIGPELRTRLFQSFVQGDGTAVGRTGGSGLGLALGRRLSELLGGTLWLESTPGQGSTFYFSIVAERAAGEASFYLPGVVPLLHGKRALIVAEAEPLRRFLALQLRAWGLLPRQAATHDDALASLRQGDPFDLAVVAPVGDHAAGASLVAAVRALRPAAGLPMVLLTGAGTAAELYQTAAGSVQAFLHRPLKPTQLHAVLVSLLAAPAPAQPRAGGALRVLLVEDDPTNQVLTAHLVRQLGHQVAIVDSGARALAALEQGRYDLMLLDVRMPEMDGFAVAEAICRRWPRAGRPRLVALTANAVQGDRERCLAAGMDDYLSKPVSLQALGAALAQPAAALALPAPEQAGAPGFDRATLGWARERLDSHSASAFETVVRTYLEDATRLLNAMAEAAAARRGPQLAHLAHKLKSSSAIVGATRLSELCQALESAAGAGGPATWRADVAAISAEYERVRVYLGALAEVDG